MSLHQYNTKIESVLGDTKIAPPKNEFPIHYGIELECEVKTPKEIKNKDEQWRFKDEIAKKINPIFKDYAFTKHDGSLKNGFEVVSVPMSLESHYVKWVDLFKQSRPNGLMIRQTCGMHVHVSRELLSDLTIGKILYFVYSKDNAQFIKDIAGRKPPAKYANMDKPKKFTDVKKDGRGDRARYSAINITGSETIEFRIFKGTLNRFQMLKNIEFCDALVKFCWPSHVGLSDFKDKGLGLFCQFVLKNRNQYSNLFSFMVKRGYIDWAPTKSKKNKSKSKS